MASPGSVVIQFLVDAKKAARDAADLAKGFGKVDKEADRLDASLDSLESELDSIGSETAALKADMRKAEVGFDGVGDEAEKTADRLRRAARDMADGVHDGGTKIDHETDGIRGSMGETGREAGAEFIGNIAEGIGSGQANLNDVVSGTLGGITNLAATIAGPVGIAAGAAAAGIGLVFAAVKGQAEAANTAIDELTEALKDLGTTSSNAAREVIFQTWLEDAEKVPGKVEAINSAIKIAGATADDLKRALAGDPKAMERVRGALSRQYSSILASKRETGRITEEQKKYLANVELTLAELGKQAPKLEGTRSKLSAISELAGTTADKVKHWNGNLDDTATVMELIRRDQEKLAQTHDIDFNVKVNGRKISPGTLSKLDPNTWAAPTPPTTGPAAQAAVATVNVYTSGPTIPNSPRAVRALLDSHDLRMGRKPGTPRARAW